MSIRPEDLTRTEQSRMTVSQTLGGAWVDDFGPGVPTVNLAGTTGWGAGGLPDGFEQFKKLHETVFEKWHKLRAEVAREGKDPDGVKLIFSDGLDDFVWAVVPQNFILKRNKARPLLSQYQIALVKQADSVIEPKQKPLVSALGEALGLSSLDASINSINNFAKNLNGSIASALGPLKAGVDGLVKKTSGALSDVRKLVGAGTNLVREVAGPVMEIAQGLTKVASNVFRIMASTQGLKMTVKNAFMAVAAAFTNAFCLLRNAFKSRGFLPQYQGLYGSSYCSSTAGGSPVSPYVDRNVFPELFPAKTSAVSLGASAEKAISTMANMDPLKPAAMPVIGGLLATINNGVSIASSVVDKAVAEAKGAAGSNLKMMGAGVGYV